MIVNKIHKNYIDRKKYPNTNWTGDNENYYLVDSNSELAKKIRENAPYFDFVLDEKGELIDITPTERPPEPEPTPSLEEKVAEQAKTIAQQAEIIAQQQEQLTMLTECMLEVSEYVYQ